MKKFLFVLTCLVFLMVSYEGANAQRVIVALEQQIQEADIIIVGRVYSVVSNREPPGSSERLFTKFFPVITVEFEDMEVIKGEMDFPYIRLYDSGGEGPYIASNFPELTTEYWSKLKMEDKTLVFFLKKPHGPHRLSRILGEDSLEVIDGKMRVSGRRHPFFFNKELRDEVPIQKIKDVVISQK